MNPPWSNPWHGYDKPDPGVFIRPPLSASQIYEDPWYNRRRATRYISVKYPDLHPLLAPDTTRVRFDVKRTHQNIDASTWVFSNRHVSATKAGVRRLRIISKAFPWTIDIDSPTPVTCGAVWEALYHALQEPIADSEWGLILSIRGQILSNKKQREVIEQAAKRRLNEDKTDKVQLRRIDYLGEATIFKGLDKDDEFAKLRLLPGDKKCPDTWVVSFSAP